MIARISQCEMKIVGLNDEREEAKQGNSWRRGRKFGGIGDGPFITNDRRMTKSHIPNPSRTSMNMR